MFTVNRSASKISARQVFEQLILVAAAENGADKIRRGLVQDGLSEIEEALRDLQRFALDSWTDR